MAALTTVEGVLEELHDMVGEQLQVKPIGLLRAPLPLSPPRIGTCACASMLRALGAGAS